MAKAGGFTYTVTLVPNLDKLVKQQGSVQGALLTVAEAIASTAQGVAPVGTDAEHDQHPGAYRDGISAGKAGEGAVVVAAAPHSTFVEFGVPGRGIPANPVLALAAEANGLKLG